MRSDGVMFDNKLIKYHCSSCGFLFQDPKCYHINEAQYRRSDGTSESDIERHQRIASRFAELINKFHGSSESISILEVGAGNYETSIKLAETNKNFKVTALEPSPEIYRKSTLSNLNIYNGNLESFSQEDKFDIIFSNHVLEHMPALKTQTFPHHQRLLKHQGIIIFAVPACYPATEEILFTDHLYTFSKNSMIELLKDSSLELISINSAKWDTSSILYTVKHKAAKQLINSQNTDELRKIGEKDQKELLHARQELCNRWKRTAMKCTSQINQGKTFAIFGAGEYAQLIQCYFPELYRRAKFHIVTSKKGSRIFPLEVKTIDSIDLKNIQCLLAVNERSSKLVSKLLKSHGCDDIMNPPCYGQDLSMYKESN